MSSSADVLAALTSTQYYLFRYICPVVMFLGSIGCIINLMVFTQAVLRKNPCAIYFIAYNISNFIYICAAPFYAILNVGYRIDLTTQNLVLCRLRLYTTILCNVLCSFYLVLAAIDRTLITSSNARTRQRSTLRMAYTCVAVGTTFWMLFHSPELYFANIIPTLPNVFICYFQDFTFRNFLSNYSLIKEITTLVLLTTCGLWSIRNIRRSARRIGCVTGTVERGTVGASTVRSTSSKDRQLALMLLMDIMIYGLFFSTYTIYLLYQQVTRYYVKSTVQVQIESAVNNLFYFVAAIPVCTSFYTNLIASNTFRNEVRKVLSWKRLLRIH